MVSRPTLKLGDEVFLNVPARSPPTSAVVGVEHDDEKGAQASDFRTRTQYEECSWRRHSRFH